MNCNSCVPGPYARPQHNQYGANNNVRANTVRVTGTGSGVFGTYLQNLCSANTLINVGEGVLNGAVETAFADIVATPIVCALTECEDGMENPFSPNVMCLTRHTTYWILLTNTANGAGRVSFRFPKAGDYLLEVVALMSTPAVTLKPLAAIAGYRIAFTRNLGAVMLAFNKFTVNSVDLITFDYHYIIAYWNFALTQGKFNAYRFCVGDVPTLTAPQIALQPYMLSVPIPYYFGNTQCRSFPLVGAGFSDLQVTIQSALSWADVLIVYKMPISVAAQLLLISRYGTGVVPQSCIAQLGAGNLVATDGACRFNLNFDAVGIFGRLGEVVTEQDIEYGLSVESGLVTRCARSLISGLTIPLSADPNCAVDLGDYAMCDAGLYDASQLPLGQLIIADGGRARGKFLPQSLWRPFVSQSNDCRNIFLDSQNLTVAPAIVAVALYGIVTNSMRTALQSCELDYAIQTVQMATSNMVTMAAPNNRSLNTNAGNTTETQLNFLYAVTAILYMAENETSKLFGIYGNYSANILSYAGPDPLTFMQLNYESSNRWSGTPEVLTRLEALYKAPRYPRSLRDAALLGNAFTGELDGTPNYFDILDDINGLNMISYGANPFDGCVAGGVVDYGTITVTFRARIRSANPNCIFVHSNGGGDVAGAIGLLCNAINAGDADFAGFPLLPEMYAPDVTACMPADFTVHIYAISYQIIRFANGLMGYAIL